MAPDEQSDRNILPNASVEKQKQADDLDRAIEQPSDIEHETVVKATKAVETPTDPFAGFGSFS